MATTVTVTLTIIGKHKAVRKLAITDGIDGCTCTGLAQTSLIPTS